jgi:hypothetical protein
VLISASSGGSVSLGDGTAIEIPAGALAADTEVTLSLQSAGDFPTLEDAIGVVAVLEPAGTSLSTPATLVVKPDETLDPGLPGRVYVLANETWLQPEISFAQVRADGTLAAEVYGFEPIAFTVDRDAPLGPAVSVTVDGAGQPLAGVEVQLWTANETLLTTRPTDSLGNVRFVDLSPGGYFAVATPGADWCGSGDQTFTIEADEVASVNYDFSAAPCAD